jgi:RNA-directed DNA polymerase
MKRRELRGKGSPGRQHSDLKRPDFLQERGLSLSFEKTHITSIYDGYDFLGWNIRKYKSKKDPDGILLIKPSKNNIKAFLDKIREIIKTHKTVNQDVLIKLLNPIIRGWANYHEGVVAKVIFEKCDSMIWRALWNWCRRRHSHKPAKWIRKKYFKTEDTRNWVFMTKTNRLILLSDTKIVRYIPMKSEMNPYDPEWFEYLENRKFKLWATKNDLYAKLFKRQKGTCPLCNSAIDIDQELDIHHKLPKAQGGDNKITNLQLTHGVCHRQSHANKPVRKPKSGKSMYDILDDIMKQNELIKDDLQF